MLRTHFSDNHTRTSHVLLVNKGSRVVISTVAQSVDLLRVWRDFYPDITAGLKKDVRSSSDIRRHGLTPTSELHAFSPLDAIKILPSGPLTSFSGYSPFYDRLNRAYQ